MIAVIDYGMGNLRSVEKALMASGGDARIVSSPNEIEKADKVVFPGVGAFKEAMAGLGRRGLISAITDAINSGKPFLGLCLGLQLLFDESEEGLPTGEAGGKVKGLGIIKGRVKHFDGRLKVPHIGWNEVKRKAQSVKRKTEECPLFKGIEDGVYFYFVHSYYVVPEDRSIIAAETGYGINFVSAIWKDNIFATQFHPEKSQSVGLQVLKNFVEL